MSKSKEPKTFESITYHLEAFDTAPPMAVKGDWTQRFTTVYAAVRPVLLAITVAAGLIPSTWRTGLRVFVATLDEAAASFKAGKDL